MAGAPVLTEGILLLFSFQRQHRPETAHEPFPTAPQPRQVCTGPGADPGAQSVGPARTSSRTALTKAHSAAPLLPAPRCRCPACLSGPLLPLVGGVSRSGSPSSPPCQPGRTWRVARRRTLVRPPCWNLPVALSHSPYSILSETSRDLDGSRAQSPHSLSISWETPCI